MGHKGDEGNEGDDDKEEEGQEGGEGRGGTLPTCAARCALMRATVLPRARSSTQMAPLLVSTLPTPQATSSTWGEGEARGRGEGEGWGWCVLCVVR